MIYKHMRSNTIMVIALTLGIAAGSPAQAQIGIFKKEKSAEDTIYHLFLDTVTIEARNLKNYNFNRYEYVVRKVYPLADTATALFYEVNSETATMKRRESKKYRKKMEKELKENFEDRLKNMSRTEGLVLIKIIERNTGMSLYDLLKDVKSGSTAWWWNNLGKMYGYDLKRGYSPSDNPMLEIIIQEYETKKGIQPRKPLQ
ncbi:MAG: hypothetical protein ABR95_03475 [Sphingobacteriales bacterium BACL12 MAG-120813-bin55]|jgi:hypothetical protein|nr:MAG: hypothetical protein ABR95_03475 [Sphingobacteriales bacterium BACL12 MAG-120813-bin55]